MTDELEDYNLEPEGSHPDFLRRKPIDVTQEDWEQHLITVRFIVAGIRKALPKGVSTEVKYDLVQDALVYLLEHGGSPYFTGARLAQSWKRENFKSTRDAEGRIVNKHISPSFSDMDPKNEEGDMQDYASAVEDTTEQTVLDDAGCKRVLKAPDDYSLSRELAKALLHEVQQQSPVDYAIVIGHLDRKHKGGRFTRAENTQYESAMRRLSKLVLQLKPEFEGKSWGFLNKLMIESTEDNTE